MTIPMTASSQVYLQMLSSLIFMIIDKLETKTSTLKAAKAEIMSLTQNLELNIVLNSKTIKAG